MFRPSALLALSTDSGSSAFPRAPTRDELIAITCPLQGLVVDTRQYGTLQWFEPALGWLDRPEDRQAVYAVKRQAGHTHVNLTLSGQYREGGQDYANIPGKDFSLDFPAFRALLEEVIAAGTHLDSGFKILLMLAGDGQANDQKPYNDPQGMTYGYEWLKANFQRVYDALAGKNGEGRDLTPWIVWVPGYDGVVPAWQPWSLVDEWLLFARSVVGNGVLGLELAAGYWAWSGETDDYNATRPNGTRPGAELDVVLYEFPVPMGPPAPVPPGPYDQPPWDPAWNQVLQVSKRLLGPHYVRPSDLPSDYDPGNSHQGPLSTATARGPRSVIAFEVSTYLWVRHAITRDRVDAQAAYLHAMGY